MSFPSLPRRLLRRLLLLMVGANPLPLEPGEWAILPERPVVQVTSPILRPGTSVLLQALVRRRWHYKTLGSGLPRPE